uniref:Uncharacterized protein n=1 Tax=Candidatus Kentrum sp. TC TaxID=2126339 RepID=A0A450ZK41_9GAMM|nr:MAG: hypothetical protein BECKTC1821E_GA0114239_103813 [Candidatus Kentron sp. TC]VFK54120.1 MAG: hypothetical protein BECKTC1821F_GA0114240_100417 [Candidatus Kentron sp. TC]
MAELHEETTMSKGSGKGVALVFLLMITIGVGAWFAGTHHVVNTRSGIKVYLKRDFSFNQSYVDMQSISFTDLRYHKDVVEVMANHGDLAYVPGGESLIAAARAGQSITEAVNRFDNEYQLSSSLREMNRIGNEKYQDLDRQYDISGKAEKIGDYMQDKAQKFNKWLKDQ